MFVTALMINVNKKVINIEQHLREREVKNFQHIILAEDCCYFVLYNLSGQIVGTQRYSPTGTKKFTNAERKHLKKHDINQLRYVPYYNLDELVVWGLHSYDVKKDLYIVEGIFDAIILHNLGLSAIATLSNDPKHLKSWLRTLPNRKIVIPDNDEETKRGDKMLKYGDIVYRLPIQYHDLNDMGTEKFQIFHQAFSS